MVLWGEGGRGCTDFGGALHLEDFDAFGDGGAGVVDDIAHGLVCRGCVLALLAAIALSEGRGSMAVLLTLSCIIFDYTAPLEAKTVARLREVLIVIRYEGEDRAAHVQTQASGISPILARTLARLGPLAARDGDWRR